MGPRILATILGIFLLLPGLCSFVASFFMVPAIVASTATLFQPGSLEIVLIWLGGFVVAWIGFLLIGWGGRGESKPQDE